ncbi:Ig-like domain-containing protein [Nostoc sp. CHAB 5844]|nr:Ig-like domain-containing protein [Nostoc sp. CHAB 5844]
MNWISLRFPCRIKCKNKQYNGIMEENRGKKEEDRIDYRQLPEDSKNVSSDKATTFLLKTLRRWSSYSPVVAIITGMLTGLFILLGIETFNSISDTKVLSNTSEVHILVVGEDGKPISGAEVIFFKENVTSGKDTIEVQTTDDSGYTQIEVIKNTNSEIVLRKRGYKPLIIRLDAENTKNIKKIYMLTPQSVNVN